MAEYYAYNAVGSVVANTDQEGFVIRENDFDAYGNQVREQDWTSDNFPIEFGGSQNDLLFSTKERDFSTGLDYFGFRYYDPVLGKFTTMDPLGYPDGPNNYLYVNNNPINAIDPLGLKTISDYEEDIKKLEKQRDLELEKLDYWRKTRSQSAYKEKYGEERSWWEYGETAGTIGGKYYRKISLIQMKVNRIKRYAGYLNEYLAEHHPDEYYDPRDLDDDSEVYTQLSIAAGLINGKKIAEFRGGSLALGKALGIVGNTFKAVNEARKLRKLAHEALKKVKATRVNQAGPSTESGLALLNKQVITNVKNLKEGKYVYVYTKEGGFRIAKAATEMTHKTSQGLYRHKHLVMNGEKIRVAGEINVAAGRVVTMSDKSGHFMRGAKGVLSESEKAVFTESMKTILKESGFKNVKVLTGGQAAFK